MVARERLLVLDYFVVDSGSSLHMVKDRKCFLTYQRMDGRVQQAGKAEMIHVDNVEGFEVESFGMATRLL